MTMWHFFNLIAKKVDLTLVSMLMVPKGPDELSKNDELASEIRTDLILSSFLLF